MLKLIIAFITGITLGIVFIQYEITRPSKYPNEYLLHVKPGDTLRIIGNRLNNHTLLTSPLIFYRYGQFKLQALKLKMGVYRIPPYASLSQIIAILHHGKTILYKITIPEGLTVQQILKLFESYSFLEPDLTQLPPEGSLYPSTYLVSPGTRYSTLIHLMSSKMTDILNDLWNRRQHDIPLSSSQDALILASIVERETALPVERPLIASVLLNRLRRGMKLQADPTTIYGISNGWGRLDRSLTKVDMTHKSVHNTYIIPGLPPTPIANPGKASLEAVLLNPAITDALYFVANGDGGHHFSAHLKNHNKQVAKLKKLKKKIS